MGRGEAMQYQRTKLWPLIVLVSICKNIEDRGSNYGTGNLKRLKNYSINRHWIFRNKLKLYQMINFEIEKHTNIITKNHERNIISFLLLPVITLRQRKYLLSKKRLISHYLKKSYKQHYVHLLDTSSLSWSFLFGSSTLQWSHQRSL